MINHFHLSCLPWRLNDELLHYILKIVVRESCVLITKCQTVSKDDFQRLLSTVPVSKMCFDKSISAFGFFSSSNPSLSLSTKRWNFYSCLNKSRRRIVFCLCCAGMKRIISHSIGNNSVMLECFMHGFIFQFFWFLFSLSKVCGSQYSRHYSSWKNQTCSCVLWFIQAERVISDRQKRVKADIWWKNYGQVSSAGSAPWERQVELP